ncbi:hypothetical protein INR49_028166 [Caranx melampygus]|nr:hypothetical protein INR49_028166 [Caranx melampygus]
MIGKLAALVLLSAISLTQTTEDPALISLTVVELGGNVTLTCPVLETEGDFFHWFKQPLGHMVQTIASGVLGKVTPTEQFKGSRFAITRGVGQSLLTISNVCKEDEATYFCQNETKYSQNFVSGTFLAVNGKTSYTFIVGAYVTDRID